VDRLLGEDGDEGVEKLGGLDGLVEIGGEAGLFGPRLAAAQRGEENQRQGGPGPLWRPLLESIGTCRSLP
jgi:hypothetical protein